MALGRGGCKVGPKAWVLGQPASPEQSAPPEGKTGTEHELAEGGKRKPKVVGCPSAWGGTSALSSVVGTTGACSLEPLASTS